MNLSIFVNHRVYQHFRQGMDFGHPIAVLFADDGVGHGLHGFVLLDDALVN